MEIIRDKFDSLKQALYEYIINFPNIYISI